MQDSSSNQLWKDLDPQEVLEKLLYELYGPVSALGNEVDRLASGTFEDDELLTLIEQLREGVNHLSTVIVALKQYTKGRQESQAAAKEASE